KNGHNVEVIEAMIDRSKKLELDGKVLNEKGQILTLTNEEAERSYGDPPKPLLSAGTVASLDTLLDQLGFGHAQRLTIQPTGAETLAMWITRISPLLLMVGIVAFYIEMKTPGFGIPGMVSIAAFAVYFLGGYIAGLSGWEWPVLFFLGVALVALELFLFPGTMALGLTGAAMMFVAIVMGMVDLYPGMPALPSLPRQLGDRARDLLITFSGSAFAIWLLSRWLPRTSLYGVMVSGAASGVVALAEQERRQERRIGQTGVAVSTLRPGGKARFGEEILDVISNGEMIEKGRSVRVTGHSGAEAVVEPVE
ncbi:MAG TPA: NfeD family protein, partial [Verrucomicrobiae bacterium]|nr:NfeD family protein [Verrucomicrobiae bacterium]